MSLAIESQTGEDQIRLDEQPRVDVRSAATRVMVVGPLSGPTTGRMVATGRIVDSLRAQGMKLVLHDVAITDKRRGVRSLMNKAIRFVRAALDIPRNSRSSQLIVYMPVDNNKGIYLNLLLILVASRYAARIVLHHHAHDYLSVHDKRMERLTQLAGKDAVHVHQCRALCNALADRYEAVENCLSVSNAAWIPPQESLGPRTDSRKLSIGHLSNLSVEKGLVHVVNVLRESIERGIDATLVLGGAPLTDADAEILTAAQREFGDRIDHRGPVYGDEKARFFADIDVSLFPTIYKTETEGIVTLESLSHGVPVIAYGRGCIPTNLRGDGALVVPIDSDFVEPAVDQLQRWTADSESLEHASEAALQRSQLLYQRSQASLQRMIGLFDPKTAALSFPPHESSR